MSSITKMTSPRLRQKRSSPFPLSSSPSPYCVYDNQINTSTTSTNSAAVSRSPISPPSSPTITLRPRNGVGSPYSSASSSSSSSSSNFNSPFRSPTIRSSCPPFSTFSSSSSSSSSSTTPLESKAVVSSKRTATVMKCSHVFFGVLLCFSFLFLLLFFFQPQILEIIAKRFSAAVNFLEWWIGGDTKDYGIDGNRSHTQRDGGYARKALLNLLYPYLQMIRKYIPLSDAAVWVIITVVFASAGVALCFSAVGTFRHQKSLHKEEDAIFCVNQMNGEEFHNKTFTVNEVAKLMASREYQMLRSRKGKDVSAWNWQSRHRIASEQGGRACDDEDENEEEDEDIDDDAVVSDEE